MKLSIVFLNALVATSSVSSLAVSSNPSLALLSHDTSPKSLLEEATNLLRHFSRKTNPSPAPNHAIISTRAPQNDSSNDGYPSAQAEAQALGLHGGFRAIPTTASQRRGFNIAHGTLMGLAFTLWFPLGAVVMHTTRNARLHAALQAFAYANALAGLGLGVWLGRNVRYLDYAHTVIGMAVVVALVLQLALGAWAHWRVVVVRAQKERAGEMEMEKEKRGQGGGKDMSPAAAAAAAAVGTPQTAFLTWASLHRWLGRCLIALGIINGGLGLKLAQNTRGGEIAYGLVAGLVAAAYLSLLLSRTWRRRRSMTMEEPAAPRGGMLT